MTRYATITVLDSGRLMLEVYDERDHVTDIIEGPIRFILTWLLLRFMGNKFAIRKVRK